MSTHRFSLAGRRALVTGANSGIGRAIALGLAEMGAELALHHHDDRAGAETVSGRTGQAPVFEADFTQPGAAAALAGAVQAQCGPIDILVANAAIERRMPWTALSQPQILDHVTANLMSLVSLMQALVPSMQQRRWGRVVAIGSVMAARPRAETLAYAAVKSAQATAIRAVAREVAGSGVTMNIVSPGAIEIERNASRYAEPAFRAAVVSKIPAARPGAPDDVAGAVLFLCSNAASYITGADIPVDGGWTIGDPPGSLPETAQGQAA